jgi:zinc transport system substrate-binding protein
MRKSLLLFLLIPGLGSAEPLRVFASVVPIQTFIAKIGGEHVDARAMVRPGYNPHTYDPTPQQISALSDAVLYVRTGVPFELAWMDRISSANTRMQLLDAREGIDLREMQAHDHDEHGHETGHHGESGHNDEHEEHGHETRHDAEMAHDQDNHVKHTGHDKHEEHEEHHHGHEQDPHVWVSPPLVKHMIGRILDKLTELAPDHAKDFARNHDELSAELDALDAELHKLLDPLPNRKFMVFHPAWGYFADSYGLTQVSIEREGKEPGARGLAALIEQAQQEKIKVVFVQPQFDKRQARQVAKSIGGIVVAVDPLAADYANNLRRVGQQFAQALTH